MTCGRGIVELKKRAGSRRGRGGQERAGEGSHGRRNEGDLFAEQRD